MLQKAYLHFTESVQSVLNVCHCLPMTRHVHGAEYCLLLENFLWQLGSAVA